MNALKSIRERLGVTQIALGEALGVTQGNVSFYEKGQTVPPAVAAKLIDYAKGRGVALTFDDIYAYKAPHRATPKARTSKAAA
jgi:putative transcriptional regulator